ncbi:MAG: tRNA dihydrouridine synthase DusB [Defluviitaleaceae bacterium]|nr:tRNA dihydrouridine synthase DusB [Defluviitaleaceae bacterium]
MSLLKPIKIGNLDIPGNIFLAPMAGVTDLVFREICKSHGAFLVYTELISAKGILYESANTQFLTQTSEKERPTTLQIFGSDPKILASAAQKIEHLPFDILDINMGCPAKKIVNNGEGSALIEFPKKVGEIVRTVSRAIKKPVTVKIRKGINGKVTALEVAKEAEAGGAVAIAVHGRTREQQYEGVVDLDIIAKVKESVTIPVIASGDVVDTESAKKTFSTTGADALMIGRGTFGNPWIFSKLIHFFKTGETLPDPTPKEKMETCLEHVYRSILYRGEHVAIREMRKHCGWYIKGLPGAAALRTQINKASTYDQLKDVMSIYTAN